MRVLVRDPQTALFLTAEGYWVKEPVRATNFHNCRAATRAARDFRDRHVQIVVTMKNSSNEIVLPSGF